VQSLGTVQDFVQRPVASISQGTMKKARSDISSSFNHGRNPRCIAAWSHRFQLSKTGAEMQHHALKLGWALRDETGSEILSVLVDQALNFLLQRFYLDGIESNVFLALC
jgi:hypothetical protein